jgi:hypothetical protein
MLIRSLFWWNRMHDKKRTIAIKGKHILSAIKSLPGTNLLEKMSAILACYRDGRKPLPAIRVKSSSSHWSCQ